MNERRNGIQCLRLKIGDCGGCPIAQMAEGKIAVTPRGQELIVVQRIQKKYCPTGENMDIPRRCEPPIWQV